jgi:DNA polymerase III subunit gamma/tau
MDNFIVSARKYRPATFDTVVGQGHITNTLKNAIKTGHLAQAFLFCGPRGVGKTTCARILAKTINCTNRTENTEACDKCESCVSFNSGASHNVFELDAASNNSVDDIRNLIDQVRYAPQLGDYKIYVIDEVHMLSSNAFNAFLKTLEEPPKHAIFILATTEKHKIIPTILSRCQIFDFNRIQIEDIAHHLAFIAKSENVNAEADALHIIAQKADGALRDACSIFDQIVSFAGNTVTYKAVIENLNILDYDYYFQITDAILGENIPQALLVFNEILNNGFDGHNFIAGLGDHFRNLLVSKDEITLQLLEVGASIKDKYKEQAGKCSLAFLVKGITILNKTDIQYKSSKNQRLQVELALMQLCSINSTGVDTEKKNDIIKPKEKSKEAEVKIPQPIISTPQSTTAQPTTNIQQPTATKKPVIQTSSPSITQHLNPKTETEATVVKEKEEAEVAANQPQRAFTQGGLEKCWSKYASELKAKGKEFYGIALQSKKPKLIGYEMIEFSINSKTLEETINEDKMNLLGYLRRELNNYSIQLTLVMTASDERNSLYTANDRYKRLAEKNPIMNRFRQAFDLDIEF